MEIQIQKLLVGLFFNFISTSIVSQLTKNPQFLSLNVF